jgi:hypothetical protein
VHRVQGVEDVETMHERPKPHSSSLTPDEEPVRLATDELLDLKTVARTVQIEMMQRQPLPSQFPDPRFGHVTDAAPALPQRRG